MILYHFVKNKRINGTLFYCFEYFIFLNKYKDTEFWIYDISENSLEYIKNVFKDKYIFDYSLLDKIKRISLKNFSKKFKKVIILDNRTYSNLRNFLGDTIVLWHKTDGYFLFLETKTHKQDILFGSYEYQKYDIDQPLQFYWDIYPEISNNSNKILVSSPAQSLNQTIKKLNKNNIFLNIDYEKNDFNHINNFFENFGTLIYVHNILDTNNRLIVESYYYNKNIILIDDYQKDSVFIRYQQLQEYGIEYFRLTKENKMIKEYLDN